MEIQSVDLSDNGAYICESDSGDKRQVYLEVQLKPEVAVVGNDVTEVAVGENIRLTCQGRAKPEATVVWYFNGEAVTSAGRKLIFHLIFFLFRVTLSSLLGES